MPGKLIPLTYEECKDKHWTLSIGVYRNPSIVLPKEGDKSGNDKREPADSSSPSPNE
jgi:hypothetical protein